MWFNIIKYLCWIGWHVWEYLYKDNGPAQRECKRCGVQQQYSVSLGKWNHD